MLNIRQQLKLKQLISPQQIQFIKLLQIPTANLEARVKEELEINPALDEGKPEQESESEKAGEFEDFRHSAKGDRVSSESEDHEFNLDDYLQQDSFTYKEKQLSSSDDDDSYEVPIVQTQSFSESLNEQLGMLVLTERERMIADHLIGSIDEDGYLRRPIPAIVNDMMFRYNFRASSDEVESVLRQIQGFDPPGVGARDLQECLLIQLRRKEPTQENLWALKIVQEYFEEFSKKHFKRLQSMLGIDEERMKDVYSQITHLNPKPGGSQSNPKHEYIIPDFLLTVENGEIDVRLNGRNAPEL
ncbi:MAG: hypothetical protein RLZZ165_1395, partial [Bacteroidota bacterium]